MRVAVTGAGGFVGRALVARLRADGGDVVPIVRSPSGLAGERAVGEIHGGTDWRAALEGADAVVHLAARVHVMKDDAADPLAAYRRVNTAGSLNLARQAAEAGVRRLLFMSSVKVSGEATAPGRPFRRDDPPAPSDPYGISKYEAELGLAEAARDGAIEIVVVRPPLVHGPGAGGNFRTMAKWLGRGVPLPFGSATGNCRSLVGIDNLTDFAALCLVHPAAANRLYFVSDGEDVSTRDLLALIAAALGRKARLLPVPTGLLRTVAALAGASAAADRLLGSLQVDISDNARELGWTPPVSLAEGLRRAVAAP